MKKTFSEEQIIGFLKEIDSSRTTAGRASGAILSNRYRPLPKDRRRVTVADAGTVSATMETDGSVLRV